MRRLMLERPGKCTADHVTARRRSWDQRYGTDAQIGGDPAAGTHTYVFSIPSSLLAGLDPPGTVLGPACTPGVDGGAPPLGSQPVFSITVG
jgi:hypothetical protein